MGKQPKGRKIPAFASDEEEMLFWDTHDPSLYFTERVGTIEVLKAPPKKRVSLQMDEGLYERLKEQAEEKGVPQQELMREILTKALTRAPKPGQRTRKTATKKAAAASR